jgi:hypothetical protein
MTSWEAVFDGWRHADLLKPKAFCLSFEFYTFKRRNQQNQSRTRLWSLKLTEAAETARTSFLLARLYEALAEHVKLIGSCNFSKGAKLFLLFPLLRSFQFSQQDRRERIENGNKKVSSAFTFQITLSWVASWKSFDVTYGAFPKA